MTAERLHFKVDSPANIVKMCCTIIFERNEKLLEEYGSVWHDVFDGEAGDAHFQQFMEDLFPDGCTVGENELNLITNRAVCFLKTDVACLDMKANHDKARFTYWVYFAPEHKVYGCSFARHEETIIDVLTAFLGKSIEDYSSYALKQFILNSFEIKSDNSSVRSIAEDVDFIQQTVYFRCIRRGEKYGK